MRTPRSRYLLILVTVLGAGFVMINLHELGHTLLARLLGDPHASYALYRPGECLGCNIYDETKLSDWGNVINSAGGLLTTQAAALALLAVYSRRQLDPSARSILVAVLVVFLLDTPMQVVQGLTANVAAQTGLTRVDFADVLYLLNRITGTPVATLKVGLLDLALLYTGLVLYLLRKNKP